MKFRKPRKLYESAVSLKLKGFGYSHMEAIIARPVEALTALQYWVANFKLGKLNTEFKLESRKKI